MRYGEAPTRSEAMKNLWYERWSTADILGVWASFVIVGIVVGVMVGAR